MRKKILILTLNDYILYQPTILNLYDFLSPHADVTIVSFEPQFLTRQKEEKRNVVYLETGRWATQWYTKLDFIFSKLTPFIQRLKPSFSYHYLYYNHYLPALLNKYLKNVKPSADEVIAVDLRALIVAQDHFGPVHFLSLEIDNHSNPVYTKVDHKKILSVFTQSELRYQYLFPGLDIRKFIVQNSPVYNNQRYNVAGRRDFIWAGTITRRFAILECIEFFNHYREYKLVLKGGSDKKTKRIIESKYANLLTEGRLAINQEYLEAEAFIAFLASFRIGFCFYSWELIASSFNNQSAPSGKVFMYLAAGTPIIACNIPGFQFLKEFGAGVLIDDYDPKTIKKAVDEIEANYEAYSEGCYKAAAFYSFDRQVKPYVDYLLSQANA